MGTPKPRVALQFNEFDFRHKRVLEVLRKQPRNKTELVVNAVLHYLSCPDAGQDFSKESLKKTIREVIIEMAAEGTLKIASNSPAADMSVEDTNDLSDMMSAFR